MGEWPKRTAGTGQQSAESKPCGKKLISIFSDRLNTINTNTSTYLGRTFLWHTRTISTNPLYCIFRSEFS